MCHNNLFSYYLTPSSITWDFVEYYTSITLHQNFIFSKSNFLLLIKVAHSTEKIRNWLVDTWSCSHLFLKLDLPLENKFYCRMMTTFEEWAFNLNYTFFFFIRGQWISQFCWIFKLSLNLRSSVCKINMIVSSYKICWLEVNSTNRLNLLPVDIGTKEVHNKHH